MYKLTCSLLNNWLHATDADADEAAYSRFLASLERKNQPKTQVMRDGIAFEGAITRYLTDGVVEAARPIEEQKAVEQFGTRLRGASLQARREEPVRICGMDLLLVGVADAIHAGILSDVKRVQRYEYGKYLHSAQHPMYMELFQEAIRFDYLIFDGKYCYLETYRRGDFPPIQQTMRTFLRYLDEAGLMDIYQKNWEV